MVSKNQSPLTKFTFFRKWIRFLHTYQKWTDAYLLVACLFLFFYHCPVEVWNANPATGGDTGSHFWPLVTLVKEGLPNWHIRVWNPGNLGGEPHLTHYFPLPYLWMAFLSLFMPLGRAFNLGTIFPVVVFPLCVYACLRGLKTRFPIPILAAAFSLSFLYNESFSMWGGNTLSTLAGQFAHVYAFDFFLLGVGALAFEMRRKRFPWLALLMFAGVLLSHFYVALYLPLVFLCFLICDRNQEFKKRLKTLFLLGLGALGLAAWFVIPMLHNAQWNTAFGLQWGRDKIISEAFPKIFWPFAGLSVIAGVLARWRGRGVEREWSLAPALFLSLFIVSGILFFVFPVLGLVDIRVFPMMQLVLCCFAGLVLGLLLNQTLSKPAVWFWSVPLVAMAIWWPARQIFNFPYWMKWNYSGWEAKSAYPDLKSLTESLKGDFSQGRIIYENSDLSNAAGTMRVFEMLPYFAHRATYESVYMQATILAPAAFYMQALISKSPSCPFPNYQCTSYDLKRIEPYLSLMGISDLILITPELNSQATQSDFLVNPKQFGMWTVYHSKKPAPLVEVVKTVPEFVPFKNFKQTFYQWFMDYQAGKGYWIAGAEEDKRKISDSMAHSECHPELKVDFDVLKLTTDCPGVFHVLKFAYHSTFEASTGDRLYLVSPGFIGIIPSSSEVILRWGQHWLWTLSNVISWITLLGLILAFTLTLIEKFKRSEK